MQVDREVLDVLARSTFGAGLLHLPEQLDRKLYMKTNKVIEAAGGKWVRSAKAHQFGGIDAGERIEQIILTQSVVVPRDEFDYFPTPPMVVHAILDAADCSAGMTVLEPSAGTGNIAKAFQPFAVVDCVEVLASNCEELSKQGYRCVHRTDFLTIEPEAFYDRVVMNPPFSKRRDMAHVTHAFKFLKPGGRLVAVMPPSFTYRSDRLATEFRELVQSVGGTWEDLPEASFKSSGTMVRTVLLTMDKPA